MTYSIAAIDPETGDLGVAVQTHQIGVGWMVPWLIPGLGAIATQSLVNINFGQMGLAMLKKGVSGPKVVEGLIASDDKPEGRQLAVVDPEGRVGAWTGPGCIPEAGHYVGEGYSVQANMMTTDQVIPAMREAYEQASGRFADRLVAALIAAEEAGGDIRGKQSAALKIVVGDPKKALNIPEWEAVYDLRIDENDEPLTELARLVRLRTSQIISDSGVEAIEAGDRERAFSLFAEARAMAPELEENGFWQAIVLADDHGETQAAGQILYEVFNNDPREDYWLDLIKRLQICGFLEQEGTSEALLSKYEKIKALNT